MKKISLKDLESLGIENLSRDNLKKIQGGASQCWLENGVLNCCPEPLVYNPVIAACDFPENVDDTGGVSGICKFNIVYSSGTPQMFLKEFGLQADGQTVSNLANSECLLFLSSSSVTKCTYDCGWDGWGN